MALRERGARVRRAGSAAGGTCGRIALTVCRFVSRVARVGSYEPGPALSAPLTPVYPDTGGGCSTSSPVGVSS